METTDFRPGLEQLLARYGAQAARPTQADVEALYTRGCAEMLRLEAELLRVKRRLIAAEADVPHDPLAAGDAERLRAAHAETSEELAKLRTDVRFLRMAVDWTYDPRD